LNVTPDYASFRIVIITSPPVRMQNIVMSLSVCLSVSVSLSARTSQKPRPCPVSGRLAKQLSRKNFRFIRINWTAQGGKFLLS